MLLWLDSLQGLYGISHLDRLSYSTEATLLVEPDFKCQKIKSKL